MKTDTLSDELDRLDSACDEILELSRAHQSAVISGDLDLLNRLLDQRGRLIAAIDLRGLGLKAEDLRTGGQTGPLATRRHLVAAKLREILRLDEESMRKLHDRADEVKDQLAAMNRGRRALHEYSYVKVKSEPVFVDSRR